MPTACSDLAQRLYSTIDVQPGASILDVGCGCGDSLLLLAEKFRPKLLHGVTSLPSHAKRAEERVHRYQQLCKERNTLYNLLDVAVFCQDAVQFVEEAVARDKTKYDYILALDCAYHFHTRSRFLHSSVKLLQPGGSLGLVDLIAARPYPPLDQASLSWFRASSLPPPSQGPLSIRLSINHWLVNKLGGVPSFNNIGAQKYFETLRHAGFQKKSTVVIQDISADVFPGFSRFLCGLGQGEEKGWRSGNTLQLIALRSFGGVVRDWAAGGDQGTIRCILVQATMPSHET